MYCVLSIIFFQNENWKWDSSGSCSHGSTMPETLLVLKTASNKKTIFCWTGLVCSKLLAIQTTCLNGTRLLLGDFTLYFLYCTCSFFLAPWSSVFYDLLGDVWCQTEEPSHWIWSKDASSGMLLTANRSLLFGLSHSLL